MSANAIDPACWRVCPRLAVELSESDGGFGRILAWQSDPLVTSASTADSRGAITRIPCARPSMRRHFPSIHTTSLMSCSRALPSVVVEIAWAGIAISQDNYGVAIPGNTALNTEVSRVQGEARIFRDMPQSVHRASLLIKREQRTQYLLLSNNLQRIVVLRSTW